MIILRVPVTTPNQSSSSPFSNLTAPWMKSPLQWPSSSTASSSWMSFAASVPTHDGQVTLIGPDWMTNKGRKAFQMIRQYHTKDKQQKRQRLTAPALRTSAKVGKREELCHTLHKASRRAASTQACPCDSGRLVMQLHEAQQIWTTAREEDTRHCAVRLYTRSGGGDQYDTRKRKK